VAEIPDDRADLVALLGRELDLYKLVSRAVEKCDTLVEWMAAFNMHEYRVDFTRVGRHKEVSTVFIGVDFSHGRSTPPPLFETAIFWGAGDYQVVLRTATWAEAVRAHAMAVNRAKYGTRS
jgi:hypothetical protein